MKGLTAGGKIHKDPIFWSNASEKIYGSVEHEENGGSVK